MENFHHDSHQFYFERYLRHKMSAAEREVLEKRLAEDEELREAFDSYRRNRKQLMRELIREHTGNPYKSWISTFIYISIATAAVFVAINLYFENKSLLAEREQDKNLISRLIEKIPFVGHKEKEKNQPQETGKAAPPRKEKPRTEKVKETVEPAPVAETVVLKDTALVPISRGYIEQRMAFYRSEIDSMLTDAELLNLIYRNNHKYAEKYKSRAIGVEFLRDSSVPRSYRFDGNKLSVYGLPASYPLLLVKDENELVWIRPEAEIILVADNRLHEY